MKFEQLTQRWDSDLKDKCRRLGWRCKIRNKGNRKYARILGWINPNAIQGIITTVQTKYPSAMITSGRMPHDMNDGGDVTFRLNP